MQPARGGAGSGHRCERGSDLFWRDHASSVRRARVCPGTYHDYVRPALSARELSVWRTFLRAHASITRQMEHDLAERHMLPLPSYDVLLQLAESPQRRLRMTDLADRVLLSRSGQTDRRRIACSRPTPAFPAVCASRSGRSNRRSVW